MQVAKFATNEIGVTWWGHIWNQWYNLNYGLNRLGPWQCNALYLWQGFWDICVHATYVIQLLSCVYYLYIYNVIFQSNSSVVELCVPYPQHNFLIASIKLGESTCFSGALKRRWKQLNRQVCEVCFRHTHLTQDHGNIFPELMMGVFKEFLESSTIHGVARISSAKVGSCCGDRIQVQPMKAIPESLYQNILKLKGKHKQHFTDLSWQMCLGFGGISGFSDCRIHHWQLLRKMAGEPNFHLIHNPHDQFAGISNCDSLPTFGFKHSPQLWSSQGWKSILVWKR